MADSNLMGKRLIFAVISVLCCSAVVVLMKYDAQSYLELIKWVSLGFLGTQTITDVLGKKENEEKKP